MNQKPATIIMKRKPVTISLLILTGVNAVLWPALFLVNCIKGRETQRMLILQGLTAVIWGISFALRIVDFLKERKSWDAPEC